MNGRVASFKMSCFYRYQSEHPGNHLLSDKQHAKNAMYIFIVLITKNISLFKMKWY